LSQLKLALVVIEFCAINKLVLGQSPEEAGNTIKLCFGTLVLNLQEFMVLRIKMLQ